MARVNQIPLKACGRCYAYMPSAKHRCPFCGELTAAGMNAAERRFAKEGELWRG